MKRSKRSPFQVDDYISYLKNVRTEREAVDWMFTASKSHSYVEYKYISKEDTKYFYSFDDRCAALINIEDFSAIEKGLLIIASHGDSPRLDLKPQPFGENDNVVYAQTRYYGGIKFHHWVGIPLCLVGRIYKRSGEVINVNIGFDESDPVFTINDLAPHLSIYNSKPTEAKDISAERLNVLIGVIDGAKGAGSSGHPKKKLFDKYDLNENDFHHSELSFVPCFEPRYVGTNSSLIGGYGQDNKLCTYLGMTAFFEAASGNSIFLFTDREEVGSQGSYGADSPLLERILSPIFKHFGSTDYFALRNCILNSVMLSADVNVANDPGWSAATDSKNCALMGNGIAIAKYTGSRGKRMASEADGAIVAKFTDILDSQSIKWQVGELGKVDHGGGGTVAMHFARQGVRVFDCGPPLLGMHSPFEISSTFDAEQTLLAYKAFLEEFAIS